MNVPKFSEWASLMEQMPTGAADSAAMVGGPGAGGAGAQAPQPGATGVSAPQPGATGVSDPQHMQDEESMDINAVIEKRLNMLLDELQQKRKRPKEELVQIFSAVLQQLMNMGLTKSAAMGGVQNAAAGGAPGAPGAEPSASPTMQPQVPSG